MGFEWENLNMLDFPFINLTGTVDPSNMGFKWKYPNMLDLPFQNLPWTVDPREDNIPTLPLANRNIERLIQTSV